MTTIETGQPTLEDLQVRSRQFLDDLRVEPSATGMRSYGEDNGSDMGSDLTIEDGPGSHFQVSGVIVEGDMKTETIFTYEHQDGYPPIVTIRTKRGKETTPPHTVKVNNYGYVALELMGLIEAEQLV